MSRKETPVTIKEVDRGIEMSHESFAIIGLSRVSGFADLFGSSVQHQHFIQLTVRRAVKIRDEINVDWYHGKEELIQIDMSFNQWGELLCNMNNGYGVPCTLSSYTNKKGEYVSVPSADRSVVSSKQVHVQEFKDKLDKFTKDLHALYAQAEALEAKPSVSKADRKALTSKISSAIAQLKNSMPYMLEQYVEQVEKVTVEAKSEIEAFKTMTLHQAGIQAIASQQDLPRQLQDDTLKNGKEDSDPQINQSPDAG
jgi:ElaB/YqjD/DUF883 family membrane-anchored ribosome-binding protein